MNKDLKKKIKEAKKKLADMRKQDAKDFKATGNIPGLNDTAKQALVVEDLEKQA